jgi:hypothetical protein
VTYTQASSALIEAKQQQEQKLIYSSEKGKTQGEEQELVNQTYPSNEDSTTEIVKFYNCFTVKV